MAFGGGNTLGLNFKITADPSGAARQMNDLRASVGRSTAAISASISRSFKAASRDSEGLFTALDQARIGLEQLGRGSLGGVPNIIKSFRALRTDTDSAKTTLSILDAALVSVGVRSTKAADLFNEFKDRVKTGAGGVGKEADTIRAAFNALGIDMTEALLKPDKAFKNLLTLVGQFGPNSREGKAALDLLGASVGDVSKAAGVAGQSLAQMGSSFGAAGIAAGAAGVVIVGAMVAAAAAIVGVVKAADLMIETAGRIGTRSKEDFEKLEKSIKAAGFSVTALDRALSQQLTGAVGALKGAFDGIFVNVIREAGPALTNVLQQVAGLLKDIEVLAGAVGVALEFAFNVASGIIITFRALIQGAKNDLTALLLSLSPENLLRAIVQGVEVAAIQTDNLFKKVDKATFDSKAARAAKEKDTTGLILRELDIQLKAAKRIFDEETEAAERAGERREITFTEMTARLIAAEEKFFAEQKRIFAEERKAVEASNQGKEERALRLAEIREEELQALTEYRRRIQEIGDDNTDREEEAVKSLLELIQEAVKARRKLTEELGLLALETREVQREIDEINLEKLRESPLPAHQRQAIEENLRIQQQAEADRAGQVTISLERQRQELLELAATQAERERIEVEFNARLEKEKRRHAAVDAQLQLEADRATERVNPLSDRSLFGETFANLRESGDVSFIQGLAGQLGESFSQMSKSAGNFGTIFAGAVNQGAQAVGSLVNNLVLFGKTGPAAVRKAVAGILAALAQQFIVKAIAELAEGFAALFFNPAEAASHFKASGLFFAAAAAAGVSGRAVAGDAFSQSAGGGAGGGGSSQSQEPRQININRGGEGETLGVGTAGADVSPLSIFAELTGAVKSLDNKISSMPADHVVTIGAPAAKEAIGNAVVSQARDSAEFTNGLGRILAGPA